MQPEFCIKEALDTLVCSSLKCKATVTRHPIEFPIWQNFEGITTYWSVFAATSQNSAQAIALWCDMRYGQDFGQCPACDGIQSGFEKPWFTSFPQTGL